VNAGSRLEGPGNTGVASVMKEMAFQATKDRSAFVITREAEKQGITLSSTSDRESITYTASFLKDSMADAVDTLSDAVIGQVFHPWEVAASKARVATATAAQTTEEMVADSLHKGAFRNTLGQPTVCPAYKIGSISAADLNAFFAANFTGGNITVTGTGVSHEDLVAVITDNFEEVATDDASAEAATYYGGFESRVETGASDATYAIGFEGVAAGSEAAAPAAVLAQILGASGSVKWGSDNAANNVAAAVSAANGTVSSFNYSYTDAGLIGVSVTAGAGDIAGAVDAAVGATKSVLAGDFTDADVARAKNQIAVAALNSNSTERTAFLASQAGVTKQPLTPEAYADAILAVTTASVKAAAVAAGASKPTVVAAGNLGYAPYADTLGL